MGAGGAEDKLRASSPLAVTSVPRQTAAAGAAPAISACWRSRYDINVAHRTKSFNGVNRRRFIRL